MINVEKNPILAKAVQFTGSWNKDMKQLFRCYPKRMVRIKEKTKTVSLMIYNEMVPLHVFPGYWIVIREPQNGFEPDPMFEVFSDDGFHSSFRTLTEKE